MSRPIKQVSSILIVSYLTLISLATFCAASHEIQHSPIQHHSKGNSSHSSLCSWACQVSSKTNAADTTQSALLVFAVMVAGILVLHFFPPAQASLNPTLARGPPV
jgi:hypothetical protein